MKTVTILLKITYNILFAFLIISAGFIIITSFDLIKGFHFYVVMSGSMSPAIHTGSIVGVQEKQDYEIEDIVTAQMKNDPNQTYTHRIIEKENSDESTLYSTKGDANETADPDNISQDLIIGKVFLTIPVIGYPVSFAKTQTGFILMIIIPTIIIVSSEINKIKEFIKDALANKKSNLTTAENDT